MATMSPYASLMTAGTGGFGLRPTVNRRQRGGFLNMIANRARQGTKSPVAAPAPAPVGGFVNPAAPAPGHVPTPNMPAMQAMQGSLFKAMGRPAPAPEAAQPGGGINLAAAVQPAIGRILGGGFTGRGFGNVMPELKAAPEVMGGGGGFKEMAPPPAAAPAPMMKLRGRMMRGFGGGLE